MKYKCLAVFALSLSAASHSRAQLDLLTLRESENLVEVTSDFVVARQKGECPNIAPGYTEGVELDFWVRSTCGAGSGMLVGAYTVNRATGDVKTWGDNPEVVSNAEGKALAERLVREARMRILSPDEAQCLAVQAAQGLISGNTNHSPITVKPFGPADRLDRTEHFAATLSMSTQPVVFSRMLTISLAEATVQDEETGFAVMTARVGDLSGKLLELRTPIWLNDGDAVSVALVSRPIQSNMKNGCHLFVGGAFYSHQALLTVACGEHTIRESNVLVNLQTGAVTDPETGKSLDSADTQRVARERFEDVKKRRADLTQAIKANCRAQ